VKGLRDGQSGRLKTTWPTSNGWMMFSNLVRTDRRKRFGRPGLGRADRSSSADYTAASDAVPISVESIDRQPRLKAHKIRFTNP
jgi:hypothetical protein